MEGAMMSEKRNLELARDWFERLWSEPNLDLADEIVDTNYAPKWIQIDKRGPDQVKHEVRYFRSVFPDLKYEIVDNAPQADQIWIRYKGIGTQKGKAWGFEATGKRIEFEGVTILYVNENGKIIDRGGAVCFYDILADIGLTPPLWELNQVLNR